MTTINVFIHDLLVSLELKKIFPNETTLFGEPKVKVFQSLEWFFTSPDDSWLGPDYKGDKFDFIFITADSLKKYYYHPYKLNLRTIIEKYGKEGTKVVVTKCTSCGDCNDFVKSMYSDMDIDLINDTRYPDEMSEKIIKDYLNQHLPID